MQLILDVIKNGKNRSEYKSFRFDHTNGIIGRSEDADYRLTDPQNYISGKHLYIEYQYGQYYLRDESTNGTYLKHPYKKLPKGIPYLVNASDIYIVGDHELQVRFSDNEYTDDFIIGSLSHEPEPLQAIRELIPDDDFLYDDYEKKNESSQEDSIPQEDVLDLLSGGTAASSMLEFENDTSHDTYETPRELFNQHIDVPFFAEHEPKKQTYNHHRDSSLSDAFRLLGEKLGIDIIALEDKEREALMSEIAETILASVEGLKNGLNIRDNGRKDLRLSTRKPDIQEINPLKSVDNALQLLRQNKLASTVKSTFIQIDTHSIALQGASKHLIHSALTQFSPQNLEYKFDALGELKGPIPKSCLMWKAYTKMFDHLNHDPESGADILSPYFTKEYDKLTYSMNLIASESR